MSAADEDLPHLIALAASEFPDLPIDAAVVAKVHHWSKSIFSIKADGAIVGGIAALFLNAAGHVDMINGVPMNRPTLRMLGRPCEKAAAVYVWMLIARKNGRAACDAFLRIASERLE